MLGNHSPRQCGIATFTADLSHAIAAGFTGLDCFVLAMNDEGRHYEYPAQVRFELGDSDLFSYRRAADFLNVNSVDVLSVQHEYGIFGGKAGAHLLSLLRELRMPIVTTLHTVLSKPDPAQRAVMDEVAELSERLVVMSTHGAALLAEVHGVRPEKIDVIPHGIPEVPFESNAKDRLGVHGKQVILTFGLLSPDKGIEYAIGALPAILEKFPDTVYIVLGATHPHVLRHGDTYRLKLESRARELGVEASMIFHNRFVALDELTGFLSAADIYITPYLNAEQITSGTLAYAVGSGKAVISTPYVYATELLAEGRGVLVPWRDPVAIAEQVIGLLSDEPRRLAMRQRAAAYGQTMQWPAVAGKYVECFERARAEHTARMGTKFKARTLANRTGDLPEINLEHLRLMTDDTGMLQHACFDVPRYSDGYCIDDNARALLLMALIEEAGELDSSSVRALASRYLAFVSHAFDRDLKRFRNFMSYSRQWTERVGSEDSQGRALWALGAVIGRSTSPGRQSLAGDLFHAALPPVTAFSSPRAWANTLLGIGEYLRAFEGDTTVRATRTLLAERLLGLYRATSDAAWPWFEDRLTYSNARLPQALLVSGAGLKNDEMITAGLRSLEWLSQLQTTPAGYFAPVGSNGFFRRGGPMAQFDQQPVEACAMTCACLEALRVSGDERWWQRARRSFGWFFGQNQLQQLLYDPRTGGCRDGLHEDRVNENQGAESTLSFLLTLQEMRLAERTARVPGASVHPAASVPRPHRPSAPRDSAGASR